MNLFVDINSLANQRGNQLATEGKRLFQSLGQGATQISQTLFPKKEQYVGLSDPKAKMTRAVSVPNIDPTGMVGLTKKAGTKAAEPVFKGFTDLSTKLLNKLQGRSVVSKQFISDLSNAPDLKQPEKDLFRRLLNDEADEVNVPDFANRVKSELLPLTPHTPTPSYESISLPDELRGPIANYTERVYQSPIKTSAGNVHFSGRYRPTEAEINSGRSSSEPPNYFAHTRIEDLPVDVGNARMTELQKKYVNRTITDKEIEEFYKLQDKAGGAGIRRVIEIQSDLHQKGRLEQEIESTRMKVLDKLRDGHFEKMQKTLGVTVKDIDEYVRKCL